MTIGTIHAAVADKLAASAPAILDGVVEALVAKTLEARKNAVLQALDEITKIDREFNKLRADQVTYNENGTKATETFSKKVIDDRQKLTQRKQKIVAALENATTASTSDAWAKLTQAIGGSKPDAAQTEAE